MNIEILYIAEQMKDAYEREPWFGRNIRELLSEIDEEIAVTKPPAGHSILELIWHMIAWKEFTISRLRENREHTLAYFEKNDWRELDHSNKSLWKEGLQKFEQLHNELVDIVQQQKDDLLDKQVSGRQYNFRKLLHGIIQHDIYHIGQIALLRKLKL